MGWLVEYGLVESDEGEDKQGEEGAHAGNFLRGLGRSEGDSEDTNARAKFFK
jgi:hypothetical protein